MTLLATQDQTKVTHSTTLPLNSCLNFLLFYPYFPLIIHPYTPLLYTVAPAGLGGGVLSIRDSLRQAEARNQQSQYNIPHILGSSSDAKVVENDLLTGDKEEIKAQILSGIKHSYDAVKANKHLLEQDGDEEEVTTVKVGGLGVGKVMMTEETLPAQLVYERKLENLKRKRAAFISTLPPADTPTTTRYRKGADTTTTTSTTPSQASTSPTTSTTHTPTSNRPIINGQTSYHAQMNSQYERNKLHMQEFAATIPMPQAPSRNMLVYIYYIHDNVYMYIIYIYDFILLLCLLMYTYTLYVY